jgi:hypothetical protein
VGEKAALDKFLPLFIFNLTYLLPNNPLLLNLHVVAVRRKCPSDEAMQNGLPMSLLACHLCSSDLVVVLAVQDPEDGQEQVDNVQVEGDGCRNLFLNVIMSHDKLRVYEDIAAEDKCGDNTITQLDRRIRRKECSHESKNDKYPKSPKQIWHPACEIVLCLACKESKGNKYCHRENECFKDNPRIVERRYDRDGVGFERCETGQEE